MREIMNILIPRIIRSTLAKRNPHFDDGLYAGLCGTGSPLPDINRAGSCIAVL